MAGISGYYIVGSSGGYLGSDGLCNKSVEIEIWEADRRSLKANYYDEIYKPISSSLKSFVPNGPNDSNQARIALILFASNLFTDCPSFEAVKRECDGIDSIDFSTGLNVPNHFYSLLDESYQINIKDKADVYFAELKSLNM